jgi:hypothetical protein
MADPIIRQIAFYWRDKKAAEVNSVEVEFTTGREPLFGQDGILAYSKGQARMRLTIREVVPVTGSATTKDLERIFAQNDVACSFILGGAVMREDMAVISARYSSDTEKGVTTGEIVLEGRKPKIFG